MEHSWCKGIDKSASVLGKYFFWCEVCGADSRRVPYESECAGEALP